MLHSLFIKTLYDARRALVGWGLGLLGTVAMVVAMYPTVRTGSYQRSVQEAPEALLRAFGMDRGIDIVSGAGYLGGYLFGFMLPMLLLVFAIGAGAGAVAGEEDRGTLELLVANPVSRSRVLAEKFGAFVVMAVLLGLVVLAGVLAGGPLVGLEVGVAGLAAAVASQTLLAILFGGLAMAVGAATGSRGLAVGVGAAAAVGAYLVHSLAPLADALAWLQRLSPIWWATGNDPLQHGPGVGLLVLLAVLGAVLAMGGTLFARRDLAT
jgi:ABC-2 type transport system permease protein